MLNNVVLYVRICNTCEPMSLWLCSYTCMHDWLFMYVIQFAFVNIAASVYHVSPIQYHKVMFWIWNFVKGYFSNLFPCPCSLSNIAFMVVFDTHLINYLAFILSCAFLSALLVIFQLWWWHEGCLYVVNNDANHWSTTMPCTCTIIAVHLHDLTALQLLPLCSNSVTVRIRCQGWIGLPSSS